jgi:uncharacterized protein
MQDTTRLAMYLDFVRQLPNRRDPAHDFRHVQRIVGRLEALAEGASPTPNWDRLHFLACFHGLWPLVQDDPEFRNAAAGLLRQMGWTEAEIEDGFQGLERHLTDPLTVEEEIVHDANFLELLGAFGIAKAFTTGGARGQCYEDTADIYEKRYLDRVHFRTPVGRRLADEGRAYARAFLERLRREW